MMISMVAALIVMLEAAMVVYHGCAAAHAALKHVHKMTCIIITIAIVITITIAITIAITITIAIIRTLSINKHPVTRVGQLYATLLLTVDNVCRRRKVEIVAPSKQPFHPHAHYCKQLAPGFSPPEIAVMAEKAWPQCCGE